MPSRLDFPARVGIGWLDWRNPNPYRRYWVLSGLWSVRNFDLVDQACAPHHELTFEARLAAIGWLASDCRNIFRKKARRTSLRRKRWCCLKEWACASISRRSSRMASAPWWSVLSVPTRGHGASVGCEAPRARVKNEKEQVRAPSPSPCCCDHHVGEAYRLAQTRGQLRKKNSSARIRRRRSAPPRA